MPRWLSLRKDNEDINGDPCRGGLGAYRVGNPLFGADAALRHGGRPRASVDQIARREAESNDTAEDSG